MVLLVQSLWDQKVKFSGDIKTDTAIIAGEVKGNIEAQDFLELHSTAIVNWGYSLW